MSGGYLWYLRSYTTSRFEAEYFVLNDNTPMLVVYWGRWADARGGVGPFSKTCVARVEGGQLPELVYVGVARPALVAGVSRTVEPKYVLNQAPARHLLPAQQEIAALGGGQRMLEAATSRLLGA